MTNPHMTDLEQLPAPLLLWFDENKRVLPWREDTSPYRVWVSEIMLQQTRVEAVKPYFERFMKALPSLNALARVDEEKLLKLWEGLGYYNRARNLKRAAQCVEEQYGGQMPPDYEKLLSLPGIGSYTAGAIASISFAIPEPAVDGNVLRVLTRMTLDEQDILSQKVKRFWEDELRRIMPSDRPGDFNQAMMELGAIVCVPNGVPYCDRCPVQVLCGAYAQGRQLEFPHKKAKKERRIEQRTILLIRDGDRIVLHKRADKGLLAGMYEFPSMDGFADEKQVVRYLEETGWHVLHIKELARAKHIFSHVEWHMKGYAVRVEEGEFRTVKSGTPDGYLAVYPSQTREAYPIPAAFRAYTGYVSEFPLREEEHRKTIRGKET